MQTEEESDENVDVGDNGADSDHSPSLAKIRKTDDERDASGNNEQPFNVSTRILNQEFVSEFHAAWLRADEELSPARSTRSKGSGKKDQARKTSPKATTISESDAGCKVLDLLSLYSTPFKICIAQSFLEDASHVQELVKEMTDMEWHRKQMDLYEFHQTTDLANLSYSTNPALRTFQKTLTDVMMPWMREISGLTLTHVSASCSMYNNGDFLLAHDDLLSDRQIAFVYYLTPWQGAEAWSTEMGGALELFDSVNGQPKYPVSRKFSPRNNQFVFFKVCSKSFHQVGEVQNVVYPRLTINGWFHGPPAISETEASPTNAVQSNGSSVPEAVSNYNTPVLDDLDLSEWINTTYLQREARECIQEHIEDKSEASLEMFLIQEFYDLLVTEFRENNDLEWVLEGPANQRKYETLRFTPQSSGVPRDLHTLFSSKSMFTLLHQYTELDLDGPKTKTPTCSVQICRFTQGCYTLLGDSSTFAESALDVILFFNVKNLVGTVTYLSPDCANNESSGDGDGNTNTSSSSGNGLAAPGARSKRATGTDSEAESAEAEQNRSSFWNRTGGAETSNTSGDIFDDSFEDEEVVAIMNRDLSRTSTGAGSSDAVVDEKDGDEEVEDEEVDGEETEDYDEIAREAVLLTVHPKNNSLNLVYRRDGQTKFVKYVSKSSIATDEYVYILFATFKE